MGKKEKEKQGTANAPSNVRSRSTPLPLRTIVQQLHISLSPVERRENAECL